MNELQFAVALVAGMLAVLNPCGFAMLPGYMALLVASGEDEPGADRGARLRPLGRALATAAAMTGGFVVVFGGFGLLVAPFALSVEPHLPWVTVIVGLAMIGLGAWLLSGRDLSLLLPKPMPGKPVRSLRWAGVYGLTYAIASLSCTIGPFLALTTAALRSTSALGVVALFLVYAAGMGLVVAVITVATALARDIVATWLRRALPYVTRISGALLAVAGAYVAYYGWFELRVFAGAGTENTVFETANRWQGEVARLLEDIGPGWFVLGLVVLLAAGAVLARLRARNVRQPTPEARP